MIPRLLACAVAAVALAAALPTVVLVCVLGRLAEAEVER